EPKKADPRTKCAGALDRLPVLTYGMGMYRFFRIQPAGLELDHRSETSNGELADGLHVFELAHQVAAPDVPAENYGDEVVVLEADAWWPNGDVEGVCVDGSKARIVARVPLAEFRPVEWE